MSTKIKFLLLELQITIYARSREKVNNQSSLISANNDGVDKIKKKVTIIQGDFENLIPFESGIIGHTLLFLLVADIPKQPGVKQIVDIEAKRISWRSYSLIDRHLDAEKVIYAIPDRKYYVTLRPTNFMSNIFFLCYDGTIQSEDTLIDSAGPEEKQEWISLYDIAQVAVNILQDPIDKHGDAAYDLVGDIKTLLERAAILSTTLGCTITYKQLLVQECYKYLIKNARMDHLEAHFFATYQGCSPITRALSLLLGRASETYEIWATKNKQ
ncbi:hypothetical protein INT45_001276 [Circinella minor]|uniref:Uncharacterized protein n=1 Tax=Circinella minor TaxID=1195481 RepID=A0A8H7VIH5_9FUNG|nr:hypothetical protein INT45_001276 [Circinella minor]